MFYVLEKAGDYSDLWDYTFLIVSLIAIAIGTTITLIKIKKKNMRALKIEDEVLHDAQALDDPESLLKKK